MNYLSKVHREMIEATLLNLYKYSGSVVDLDALKAKISTMSDSQLEKSVSNYRALINAA